jgi:hypothetical protein
MRFLGSVGTEWKFSTSVMSMQRRQASQNRFLTEQVCLVRAKVLSLAQAQESRYNGKK